METHIPEISDLFARHARTPKWDEVRYMRPIDVMHDHTYSVYHTVSNIISEIMLGCLALTPTTAWCKYDALYVVFPEIRGWHDNT